MGHLAHLARRAGQVATGLVGRLRVGQKLLLIYSLDLVAVIVVSALLLHEQFLSIDVARQEREGLACVQTLLPLLMSAGDSAGNPIDPVSAAAMQSAIEAHPRACGDARPAMRALELWQTAERQGARDYTEALRREALARSLELVRSIGNRSSLVLDPELRTYYAMSIVVMRLPEVLAMSEDFMTRARVMQEWGAAAGGDERIRLLVIGGQLDAVARSTLSDLAAALAAAPDSELSSTVAPLLQRLHVTLAALQAAATAPPQAQPKPAALRAAQQAMLAELGGAWKSAAVGLDHLLQQRLDLLYGRLWRHLGLVCAVLIGILAAVTFVARQITRPVAALADTMSRVRRTGDYSLRAHWRADNELGSLVAGFNAMLAELGAARKLHEEYVAAVRAGQAQQELVDAIPIPLLIAAEDGSEVLHANASGLKWLNGLGDRPWHHALPEATCTRLMDTLKRRTELHEFEVLWQAPGVEPAWAVMSARRLRYQGSDAVLATLSPINRIKQMEQRLALWSQVFEASSEGIVIADARLGIVTANQAFCRITGYPAEELVGREWSTLLAERPSAREVESFWRAMDDAGVWRGELVCRRRDGSSFPTWFGISVVRGAEGEPLNYIFTSMDISERRRSEERIAFLAHHDALTGLPNRALCMERLTLALQQAARNRRSVAVLFLDLDRFKAINDSLGHQAGDALLRSVAQRLTSSLRVTDTVARLGGDEFLVVLPGVTSADEAREVIERRILPVLQAPHEIGEHQVQALGSIGVALFPEDAPNVEHLVRRADLAMYQAKQSGRGVVRFYTPELDHVAQDRLQLQADFPLALQSAELELHYQPRIEASSGRLLGVEAMLRWHHPVHGLVLPSRFVPIAEECGLIVSLGAWVMEQVCRQVAAWKGTPLHGIAVSVDTCAAMLCSSNAHEVLAQALRDHGVPPGLIELELSESELLREGVAQRLQAMKALGVGLTVDDFGTGHASVSDLAQLPIDRIKIDRAIVTALGRHPRAGQVLEAIVTLGHALKLKVAAQGVEHVDSADALREARCDELQGFLIAKPMAADRLPAWLGTPQPALVVGEQRGA